MSSIELQNVTKIYQNRRTTVQAVSQLSLAIENGEIVALLGPSGSGKTTLLRLIAGFESPEEGTVLLEGVAMNRPGTFIQPERRGIGMVFQEGGLFPHMTVRQNIMFGLYRYAKPDHVQKVDTMLHLVSLPGHKDRYPHELSFGERQRVALARALAPNPTVLLLDEPFSNLDLNIRLRMRDEVRTILKQIGITAILVTHDHDEAFVMADRVAVLNAGRLEQIDTPETLYHLPSTPFVADFVGSADFLSGEIKADGYIHTEIGRFPNEAHYAPGNGIEVMIRPDDIHFIPDDNGLARVVSKQFRGSENLYRLLLPSGRIVHSSEHSLYLYPAGTRARLELTATHTVVFRKNEHAAK